MTDQDIFLFVDFETRSRVDLFKRGAYNYAEDDSTSVLCCSFIFGAKEWLLYKDEAPPKDLQKIIYRAINDEIFIAAHNAQFDRLIWQNVATRHGYPVVPLDRWYCTAAQCRVNNIPAALADAAVALGAAQQKDYRGKQLIKLLSIPDAYGKFKDDAIALQEMGVYCLQDSRTMKSVVEATRVMTMQEHSDYVANEHVNEQGIKIDRPFAEAALHYAAREKVLLGKELALHSNGVVTAHTQFVKASKWILERVGKSHPITELMKDDKHKISLDKRVRQNILDAYDTGELVVDDEIIFVVEDLHEGNKSSVAKYRAMLERADDTDVVKGAFIYAGAAQTQRYASRGLQVHNFPSRGLYKTKKEVEEAYLIVMAGKEHPTDSVMVMLSKLLRNTLISKHGEFVIGDWSGIESGVLPWLSGSEGGDKKVARIKNIHVAKRRGAKILDLYEETAIDIGAEGNRPLGKVCELALGYEGGINAFKRFAKPEGLVLSDGEIYTIINQWRDANRWCADFWRELYSAARAAIASKDHKVFRAGRIRFQFAPRLIGGTLLCILPDDTVLQFPQARIEHNGDDYYITALKSSIKKKTTEKDWPREALYGGRLAGIVTQATAAALLRDAIPYSLDVLCGHVHDELVLDVPWGMCDGEAILLKESMEIAPDWAKGLPLYAEPIVSQRYCK
jgi:DNA polymerase